MTRAERIEEAARALVAHVEEYPRGGSHFVMERKWIDALRAALAAPAAPKAPEPPPHDGEGKP